VGVAPDRRAAALRALRSSSSVEDVGREALAGALDVTPDDADWPAQWGLRLTGMPRAWSVTRGSSRVIVAVLDTGVDLENPDLRGALVQGYDFVNSDLYPRDDEGHGTSVAGIIGARANNRTGVAGVCWACSIMPVKVLDSSGVGYDSVISAGIIWAVDHGAKVVNLSLGGPEATADLADAVAYAVQHGALVVAAAGNDGTISPFYPAATPGVVGVAATTISDQRYPWSNYGSWVRLAGPGCNLAPVRGGSGTAVFCGTSSATPLVAGLAALAYSVDPNASPAEIEQALERAAVPVPGVAQYGRVSAPRTLSLVSPSAPLASTVFKGTVGPRITSTFFPLRVGEGRVTATLRFRGTSTLSLALLGSGSERPLARASGRSPLSVRSVVPAGALRLVVRGEARRSAFVLTVSYPST
jgi:subtilisin family serine protease